MKISKIETKVLKSPLHTPFQTALRRVEFLEDFVVIIHTDTGLVGYGEGSPTPVITGETMGTMSVVLDYITPFLLGVSLDDFEHLLSILHSSILKNTTAKSAIEIALYDLQAKSKNLPLFKMLGGERTKFETDITISLAATEKMVQDSQLAIKQGYKTLKIKVGANVQGDIERIKEIYNAVGNSVPLRLDANQGWSAQESVQILLALEADGIIPEFVEQPVQADDIKGLRYIKERVQTPVLADESVFSLNDARHLLETKSVDLLNIKLAKCAGISNALKLADIADEYGVKCMLGCMLEGPISVGAALHVASAKSNVITMLDLDAVALCTTNPVTGGVLFNKSKMELTDEIGLGVTY